MCYAPLRERRRRDAPAGPPATARPPSRGTPPPRASRPRHKGAGPPLWEPPGHEPPAAALPSVAHGARRPRGWGRAPQAAGCPAGPCCARAGPCAPALAGPGPRVRVPHRAAPGGSRGPALPAPVRKDHSDERDTEGDLLAAPGWPRERPPAPRRWPGPAAAVLPALPPPRQVLPPPAVLTAADPPAVGAAKAGYNQQLARAQAAEIGRAS